MKITKNILLCVYKDMVDDLQLQWQITSMDCYPDFSGAKDYVFNVHWDCLTYYSGISGGPLYGRSFSVTKVPANTGEFTPYTGLKEPIVLSWVWDVIGSETKYEYEKASFSQIYNKLVPPIVQLPIPWVPDVFPVVSGSEQLLSVPSGSLEIMPL
jgi:hypothetical protein